MRLYRCRFSVGAVAAVPDKGRRAYTGDMPGWMKEGAIVLFEGQVGTLPVPQVKPLRGNGGGFHAIGRGQGQCGEGGGLLAAP